VDVDSGSLHFHRPSKGPGNSPALEGTLMMGMLAEHRRYAHITALRGDSVVAQALGMNKVVVSEDALRRAQEQCRYSRPGDEPDQEGQSVAALHEGLH
jgi:hypothetical protein